jgi:UDP-N-acetyl-D-mannosaminuronic acid dehydrogenase
MKGKKVCVVGLGYIGLPTSAMLANHGYLVHGVDIREDVVEKINRGEVHIREPDLDAFVQSAVHSGRLKASLQPAEADVFMIAVPTPFKDGFQPDLDFVVAAGRSIAPFVRPGNLVILESTVPVGATDALVRQLLEAGVDTARLHVAFCPERVLPGRIMTEFLENDRIVGGVNEASTTAVQEFYRSFVRGTVHGTDARTAEMVKLAENSYRDLNIAFANELSILCDKSGIDVSELIGLANRHPRVNILSPGCGVGGHCIAVDPWFIVSSHPEDAVLVRTARERNLSKTEWVMERIHSACRDFQKQTGRAPVVACFGVAFKPDVDDLRESPALEITQRLKNEGLNVLAVEPNVDFIDGIRLVSAEEARRTADIKVFLVAHSPFRTLGVDRGSPNVLDFCGVLSSPAGRS